jgi:hypothetical protein
VLFACDDLVQTSDIQKVLPEIILGNKMYISSLEGDRVVYFIMRKYMELERGLLINYL